MPKSPFPNYLRTIRKRSGLSQDEVAFLLGSPSGGMVSRYERFNRLPSARPEIVVLNPTPSGPESLQKTSYATATTLHHAPLR